MKSAARKKVDQDDFYGANWIGCDYFLSRNSQAPRTTYDDLQAEHIVFNFPYNSERDDPVQLKYRRTAIYTSAVYPMCDECWDSSYWLRAGLLWRLFYDIEENNPQLVHDELDYDGFFSQIICAETTPEDKANMLV